MAESTPVTASSPTPVHGSADSARALAGAPDSVRADVRPAAPAIDYLWVVRTSMLRAPDIERVVERARAMHTRGILVQVVGRGDAYYRSDLLPRAEALAGTRGTPPDFDPLGYLLPLAHEAGLEVHAWVNCCLVWSSTRPPRDPRHVVNAHPEWIARLDDGRPMTRLGPRERLRMGVEGAFLAPAHPAVRHWVASIAKEIVTRYPVDGVHLDYIRLPDARVGYDPTTRATFALRTGVDLARPGSLSAQARAQLDSTLAAFEAEQVTAMVQEVRDSLAGCCPTTMLSAAVYPDLRRAEERLAQPWRHWILDGLIDRAFAMCYVPITQTVLDQLVVLARELGTERVVPGIAVYNTPPTTVAAKVKAARELGFRTLAIYSYDALFARARYWPTLQSRLESPTPETP